MLKKVKGEMLEIPLKGPFPGGGFASNRKSWWEAFMALSKALFEKNFPIRGKRLSLFKGFFTILPRHSVLILN
jgi:hypothetical protein